MKNINSTPKKINVIFVDSKGISNIYGIGSYRNNLLAELAKSDSVNLFCVSIKYADKGSAKILKIDEENAYTNIEIVLSANNLKTENLNINQPRISAYSANICITLIKFLSGCEDGIIHLNISGEVELCKVAKRLGFNVVATQHVQVINPQINPNDFNSILLEGEKKFFSLVDEVICLSNYTKSAIINNYSFDSRKVTLIYNGVKALEPALNKKSDLKKRFGFSKKDFIFLFVGRIEKSKGLYELIQSFIVFAKGKSNIKLVVVGGGDVYSALSFTFENMGNIVFTGFLTGAQLSLVFSLSDVGVLPSYSEQSSFSVLEMMNNGLPVIVSDIDGFELFENRKHVLKADYVLGSPGNSNSIDTISLTACMEELFNNVELRSLISINASKLLAEKLNSVSMSKNTISVYKRAYNKI
ncbi:hypothetical protein CPT03_02255 [Pedobacter ginsengisoli]|uniref:Glycosyl transferase family 1 domain-containing protein n=1 Tax=Pedobacter ginsengisoli TaxID=363852 RepID=A0A2D1U173_9SPHI|nr:glycosyltransferase [Pedobacter ginsengisoli]ATP55368.1 hypothetical protein CPT03_02255 [Pedobacter ginsengisoli]